MNLNFVLLSLVTNIPAGISLAWAGYLASNSGSGWGWFLLISVFAIIISAATINNAIEKKATDKG